MCQSPPSVPVANTSNRPSEFVATAGSPVITPPNNAQSDQGPPGAVCHLCHSALSPPLTKVSSLPSAFTPTVGLPFSPPARSLHCAGAPVADRWSVATVEPPVITTSLPSGPLAMTLTADTRDELTVVVGATVRFTVATTPSARRLSFIPTTTQV